MEDDDDIDEWASLVNGCMTDDDADDPYLESYQHYGNQTDEKPG